MLFTTGLKSTDDKWKHAYRKDEAELRFKVICSTELRGQTLKLETASSDSDEKALATQIKEATGNTEVDIRVPIEKVIKREGGPGSSKTVLISMRIALLRDENLNKGALIIHQYELYIHDKKNDIKGLLGDYKASYNKQKFVC